MNAIESSLAVFNNICVLAESKIDSHLNVVVSDQKEDTDTLTLPSLAEEIAKTLGLREAECLYSISIYLKQRPELEIRMGKNGGIHRVGDDKTKTPMTPKDCALKFYDPVKNSAVLIIEEEFMKAEEANRKNGFGGKVRLNFQSLSQIVADKLNIKPYSAYHCLRHYIQTERKDLVIELGRHGGLAKR
jgi:hypothetical protein